VVPTIRLLASFSLLTSVAFGGIVYATDPASVNAGNYSAADIVGLVRGDILTPFSFGNDPIVSDLYFTVDREAVGAPGSDVAHFSDPAGEGGANGSIYFSTNHSGTNELYAYGADLGLNPGFFGDDITGLSVLPLIDNVYFALSVGSPTLTRLGLSPADILVSGPAGFGIFARAFRLGLDPNDQLDGLVLLDIGARAALDIGTDIALFSISSFSPDATTAGGTLDPGSVYMTTFNSKNTLFRSATDLGLLPGDEIQDIATIPEPSTLSLFVLSGAFAIVLGARRAGRRAAALAALAVCAAIPGLSAETCSIMAGTSPPVTNSAGTLMLPDLTTKNFRWISNDPTFGAIDTNVVAATVFTVSNSSPQRVVFTASVNGINYQGNVLLGTYQRGTVDLYTGSKLVRYLISPPAISVSNIEFDWKSPTQNKDPSAAITLRKNGSAGAAGRLDFKRPAADPGNVGPTFGEWIKSSKNEPALYVANQAVTIKVRFTTTNSFLLKADLSAIAAAGKLPNVKPVTVSFAGGVSSPEYVTMSMSRNTDTSINKVSETWNWQTGNNNGCGGPAVQIDTSGPHTVYTVLGVPTTPWYDTDRQQPWRTALDFATDPAKVNLIGKGTIADAVTRVSNFFFSDYGLVYDIGDDPGGGGRPNYMDFVGGKCEYNLTGMLTKSGCDRGGASCSTVNCHDQAASDSSFINLVGGDSGFRYMQPNGYMAKEGLVGRGQVNNPFYKNGDYQDKAVVTEGCANNMVGGKVGRSVFANHGFVSIGGKAIDSMGGPFTGTLSIKDYITASLDAEPVSAVGPPKVLCTDIATTNGDEAKVRAAAIKIVLK
jgi:hypothetical protein